MSLAVISDVHGNLPALRAVLEDIKTRKVKDIVFIGDAVGYGPEPNECVSLIEDTCKISLAGNHDWAVLGLTDIYRFNSLALAAIRWTDGVLSSENRERMNNWPLVREIKAPEILLVHASPEAPADWPYLLSPYDVSRAFRYFSQRICFIGHSHLPFIAEAQPSGEPVFQGTSSTLKRGRRYVVNTGSVGQPRDGNPRACYALLKARSVELLRVEYPVGETQRKMVKVGLPEPLITRLSLGR